MVNLGFISGFASVNLMSYISLLFQNSNNSNIHSSNRKTLFCINDTDVSQTSAMNMKPNIKIIKNELDSIIGN